MLLPHVLRRQRVAPPRSTHIKRCRQWLDDAIDARPPRHRRPTGSPRSGRRREELGLPERGVVLRPAVRARPRGRPVRGPDDLAPALVPRPGRARGGHGVRARDVLPGDRRPIGGADRGGGPRDGRRLRGADAASRPRSCSSAGAPTSAAPTSPSSSRARLRDGKRSWSERSHDTPAGGRGAEAAGLAVIRAIGAGQPAPHLPLPPRLARHDRPPDRGRDHRARGAPEHLLGVCPSLHDGSRGRRARPDARDHAGRHRPLDPGRDVPRWRTSSSGVSEHSDEQAADSRSSPASASAWLVGLSNGLLVGILRLNPLIVTLAVGTIVLAFGAKYARGVAYEIVSSSGTLLVGADQAAGNQLGLLAGRDAYARRRALPSLHRRGPALPGRRRELAGRLDVGDPRAHPRRPRVHGGRRPVRGGDRPARQRARIRSTSRSAPTTCSRRSQPS